MQSDLSSFYSQFSVNADVANVNTTDYQGVPGGDNFGECSLDVQQSTGIGNGMFLMVSNTNTSQSTEEGNGFGYAFADFAVQLAEQSTMPGVMSLSLGSLSAYACNTLCTTTKPNRRFSSLPSGLPLTLRKYTSATCP